MAKLFISSAADPTSPVARCSACGVQRQFHAKSDVPHSADRDHEFVAETIDDFEPGDLTPEQLVDAIYRANWLKQYTRAQACRVELKARIHSVFGVTVDEIEEALA